MDTDGRCTIKRGRRRPPGEGAPKARDRPDCGAGIRLQEPFRYRPEARLPPRFAVTDAAAHDGSQLAQLLARDNIASAVWADVACRSDANVALLGAAGPRAAVQRLKRVAGRSRRTWPAATPPGRGSVGAIEHVFATQKCRLGLIIRSVGLARATAKLGLRQLVTNMRLLVWFATRAARA